MDKSTPSEKILERAARFRWDLDELKKVMATNDDDFFKLDILIDHIINYSRSDCITKADMPERLDKVLRRIYRQIVPQEGLLLQQGRHAGFVEDLYDTFCFVTLCSYLHASKRIKGQSIRDFVHDRSPLNFKDSDSFNHRAIALENSEIARFRKARNRHLSKNEVYIKDTKWEAISKDAAYEWEGVFAIESAEENVKEVCKRIKNLYSGLDEVFDLAEDDRYPERFKKIYDKFVNRLTKISYADYQKLMEFYLTRIAANKEYCGINLYRLERRFKPYIISREIRELCACQTSEERAALLLKDVILRNIGFPRLYEDFEKLSPEQMEACAAEFPNWLSEIVFSGCLILDCLVENGTFGPDWEKLFIMTTNHMAEKIYYQPETLDKTAPEAAEGNFFDLLSSPVVAVLCGDSGNPFYLCHLFELFLELYPLE